MPSLHGVDLSPFVRKVRVALAEKGIDYESIPVLPFGQSEEFLAISPLGKIPVYQDGEFSLPDSSVIIDYLEHIQPEPALYPSDPAQRGWALFLEEYADTRLVEVLTTVFFERYVQPRFMQQETNTALVEECLTERIPPVFDYLEGQLEEAAAFFVGSHFSIADIAISSPFVNFQIAGEGVDASRWPRLSAWLDAILARPHYKPIVEGDLAS